MNDRRRHHRTRCRVAACIEQYGLISADQICYTSNLSMKGIFMPGIPHRPIGSLCRLVIHDHVEPLKLNAKVSRLATSGVGFAFAHKDQNDCLRLQHLMRPQWDGKNYLEGVLLMLRHSEQSATLKDCLSMTSLLSRSHGSFTKHAHLSCVKNDST